MIRRAVALDAGLSACIVVGMGSPVAAAEGNPTGAGWPAGSTWQPLTTEERNELSSQLAIVNEYGAQKDQATADPYPRACDPSESVPCPQAKQKTLSVQHSPQNTNYYCGPASGVMLLRYLQEGNSDATGASLVQANVANAAHMNTEADQATNWDEHELRRGINKWRGNKGYIDLLAPTNKEFRNIIGHNIDKGLPFVSSTLEELGGPHYNGHPENQLIGHYVLGRGYLDKLDRVQYLDPAANGSGLSAAWANVSQAFAPNTNSFNQTFQAPHGATF